MIPENALGARRTEIDDLDRDLLRLLNRRAALAAEVLALKRSSGLPVCDPRRELEVLSGARKNNAGPLDARAVETIFRQVIYETRRSEERVARPRSLASPQLLGRARVAFQGERGAFSEQAIDQLFPDGSTHVPCRDFEALFESVESGGAEFAAVPVENCLAGPVGRCYDLLYESDLHIVAEATVRISHCLIGFPGARLEGIRTVESHPVALAQCQHFFLANPQLRAIAADDTAGSVRSVMESGDASCAAIAGVRAAKTYGAEVLAERLEDHAENFTRFIVLSRAIQENPDADKCSLVIGLSKRIGVLRSALAAFADRGIDLVAIHPRPVVGRPWEYRFFLDLAAAGNRPEMSAAMEEIRARATVQELRVLGSYRAAQETDVQQESEKRECAQ